MGLFFGSVWTDVETLQLMEMHGNAVVKILGLRERVLFLALVAATFILGTLRSGNGLDVQHQEP